MSARSIKKDVELMRGGAPRIIPPSSTESIACEAIVLHQSEEDNLDRFVKKILEPAAGEVVSRRLSEKRKVLTKYMLLTAGKTSIIAFIVVVAYLVTVNRPLTLSDALLGAFVTAAVTFIIEIIIISREYEI